ncbi:hypothetical protein U1Q18_014354 [Sarracenia purpurea var. burkii]
MRTSEARFLFEAYIFYEAILNRGYFEGSKGSGKDLGVRFKELRFYARFLLVSLILTRLEIMNLPVERFTALVDESVVTFRETNFKELPSNPTLPSNPKKTILYHPSATRLIAIKIAISVWG